MLVVMKATADAADVARVMARIAELGCTPVLAEGTERVCVGMLGSPRRISPDEIILLPGVEKTVPITSPYKLASRDFKANDTIIDINGVQIGGKEVAMMAGPCSVESRDQLFEAAEGLANMGIRIIRGGAFKPRSSPYSFQGLGAEGLRILAEARERYGVAVVTEVLDTADVDIVSEYADVLQIGARNMQNYRLLEAAGRQHRPVLLKRGLSATMEELLLAAEYILNAGNRNVMLCERGIRTFETETRFTFDINAVPMLKILTHLPVIADPSHGTGRWDLVAPISRAAVVAGADGLILEVHSHPEMALSDGAQALRPDRFEQLLREIEQLCPIIGRELLLKKPVAVAAV